MKKINTICIIFITAKQGKVIIIFLIFITDHDLSCIGNGESNKYVLIYVQKIYRPNMVCR